MTCLSPLARLRAKIQHMLDEYLLGEEDAEDVSTETNKYQSTATRKWSLTKPSKNF